MKTKLVDQNAPIENLIEQTNELLRKNLIIQLAFSKVPHQAIRKIVGVDMKYVTDLLKPLKGKID